MKLLILGTVIILAAAAFFYSGEYTKESINNPVITHTNMEAARWPSDKNVEKIVISSYRHATDRTDPTHVNDKPAAQYVISDTDAVQKYFDLLHAVPTEGDLMIEFVPQVDLIVTDIYYRNNTREEVLIYGGLLRTPSTGFLTLENEIDKGKTFVRHIQSLL